MRGAAAQVAKGWGLHALPAVVSAVNAALDLTGSLTVEAWVRPDQLDGTWTPLLRKGDANGTVDGRTFALRVRQDGALALSTSDGSLQELVTVAGVIRVGQWQHVAAVSDPTPGVIPLPPSLIPILPLPRKNGCTYECDWDH